jgi:hypothetical protein
VDVLYLLPRTSPLSLYLNGGLGVVSRGGVAFTSQAKTSDLSGVFGAGASVSLGGLSVTAGADLFAYKAHYLGSQLSESQLTQRDFALHVGLGIPLGR